MGEDRAPMQNINDSQVRQELETSMGALAYCEAHVEAPLNPSMKGHPRGKGVVFDCFTE